MTDQDSSSDDTTGEDETPDRIGDDLSPSVRRLVRQYQLDVTGIHGSGPAGRIRVGDVMALVGGRDETATDQADRPTVRADDRVSAAALTSPAGLATVVYECDVSRVLLHQKRAADAGTPVRLSRYFVAAAAKALAAVPEVNGGAEHIDMAVSDAATGENFVRDAGRLSQGELDRALEATSEDTSAQPPPTFVLRLHAGGVFAFPTAPRGDAFAALGVGKIKRVVAVKTVNGEDTPRITAQCYLGLSFVPERLEERCVNEFLGICVREIESYNTAAIESAT